METREDGFQDGAEYVAVSSDAFDRARILVMRHGWNTTCFQIVNPGIEYWFSSDGESVVGYVTAGSARVVAGAPVCAESAVRSVALAFEADARAKGLGVCYFGAEARLEAAIGDDERHSRLLIGAQPVWHPANWPKIMSGRASLRAQFNRARNKGVSITEWNVEKATNNPLLRECLDAWFTLKGLPPMHFVIEPNTLGRLENRRIFVAEHNSKVAAFLVLSPIPRRKGWLTEQFPHHPKAPNGTVELMMDSAFRILCDEGYEYVTLGLAPLSKRARIERFDNPFWMRIVLAWLRKHGQRFYNFDGLDAFKAKMSPEKWEPVFAISNEQTFSAGTLYAIASAFSGNQPVRMAFNGLQKAAGEEVGRAARAIRSVFSR